ncbi:MAG: class I SAM-dependent rRNA methyltransferase [Acidobacteriaceae bacterium]
MHALSVSRRAADRLRSGHLWVYRSDVVAASDAEPSSPGSLVTLLDPRGLPLGTALYSSTSQIAARLVSPLPGLTRQRYLQELLARIHAALHRRRQLAPISPADNAHRIVFSEADNLPGIVADRYNDLVLLQLLTQGTAQDDVRSVFVQALRADALDSSDPRPLTIWERPDPRIRELEDLPAPQPGPLFSTHTEAPTATIFSLNGLRFHYEASAGQKTGAFLDQRLNYAAAARAVAAAGAVPSGDANGPRALDVCTYQGGFALHLAQVCARVTGVDTSRSALEAAERNLILNQAHDPSFSQRCQVDWMDADAFEYLRHLDQTAHGGSSSPQSSSALFDAIVLDPPAFAKSKRATEGALRGYKELNLRALRLLASGGTLITNSCSHHISLEGFTSVVAAAAADAHRRVQVLYRYGAAPDHPEILTLPETAYLKCLICRVDA